MENMLTSKPSVRKWHSTQSGGDTILGELAFVIILVATIACNEYDRIRVTALMALLTINTHVLALKWEVRGIVIEEVH